uniref:Uncharacterized protein n=1 Tax=Apteryx owenii TaxID=8824 RepID=A0A8B9PAP1_APTOW
LSAFLAVLPSSLLIYMVQSVSLVKGRWPCVEGGGGTEQRGESHVLTHVAFHFCRGHQHSA